MWAILGVAATCSLGLNFLALHVLSLSELKKWFRYKDWSEALFPVGGTACCLLLDFLVLRDVVPAHATNGWAGVAYALLSQGPKGIALVNEFASGLMASVIMIGYIPGGRAGFLIGLSLSLLLNIFIFWGLVSSKMKS